MSNELQAKEVAPASKAIQLSDETMSALVIYGDLSKLSPPQKVEYYRAFCQRVGLDPATQPFKLLKLNGKEVLYCDRGGASQLNKQHKVSHKIIERKREDDVFMVTAKASTPDGRETESIGAVAVSGLKGDALANAIMKAETKSKRRSTLDLLGLGMLDESELENMPGTSTTGQIDTPPKEIPPLTNPYIGKVEALKNVKSGATKGKEWTLYSATVGGREFFTFVIADMDMMADARDANLMVEITHKPSSKNDSNVIEAVYVLDEKQKPDESDEPIHERDKA